MDNVIRELCARHTDLNASDVAILESMAAHLPIIAALTGSDIFIDTLSLNGQDSVVLAWEHSPEESLYHGNVIGQFASIESEPAVYKTILSGETSRDVRGTSQEGTPVSQTVSAIRNQTSQIIGVLIMEQNITKQIWQEERFAFLSQTVEQLGDTLMHLSMTESTFEAWLANGLFILNKYNKIIYANNHAKKIIERKGIKKTINSDFSVIFPECITLTQLLDKLKNPMEIFLNDECYRFEAYPLITDSEINGCAISVQDITDLRNKEHELNIKSTIIREIHHRVKNNLQNIASILRLQMRRSDSELVKTEFKESINRLVSIALVHELYATQTWDTIDLIELAQRILDSTIQNESLPSHHIRANVEGVHVELGSSQAVPLTLVINELITNSLKHGIAPLEEGEIIVRITEDEANVTLNVLNSGPPPLKPLSEITKNSLGLQIVEALAVRQLGGTFVLERSGDYTQASVCLPKRNLQE